MAPVAPRTALRRRSTSVQGNLIGTDITGNLALGNGGFGISVSMASSNTIGGSAAGARNVISGNFSGGVDVVFQFSLNNVVKGNYIGTNALGTAALGNTGGGVILEGAVVTRLVGGTGAGEGNLISGNGNFGGVTGQRQQQSAVRQPHWHERRGYGRPCQQGPGISVNSGASNNTIGGIGAGQGNTIAFNQSVAGVLVDGSGGPAVGDSIRGNRIFNNLNMGIHL